MPSPVLQINNLRINFKTEAGITHAVNDISFCVAPCEITGIVGESGSGKSVTALSILQLLNAPPAEYAGGEIIFNRKNNDVIDLMQSNAAVLRSVRGAEISMIFQEPMTSLNPVFTCGEQIMEMLHAHEKISGEAARKKTIKLFEQVQLPRPEKILSSYPHELSGGQKQRVMIAMAICCNPKLLIADEPTTALDVTVQKAILDLLASLQKQTGMSIIFITHDLAIVAEIASSVLVMYKGKIVEQGSVENIFRYPKHPYTKGLLACRPALHQHLQRLPVISDFMEADDNGIISEKENDAIELSKIYLEGNKNNIDGDNFAASDILLEVKNIVTRFPADKNKLGRSTSFITVVNDVSFTVKSGETVGLVGESGCGKTTLGRTILGLVEASSGEIKYGGNNITHLSFHERRRYCKMMQLIFQDPYSSLNPRRTIGDAITEPMKVHNLYADEKERKEKTLELLQQVDLQPDHYYRYPHEFSGGQRQRICIARALALSPQFIICDESVAALDVSVQAQVLNLLLDLQEQLQLTYIFISHDLAVVNFMSDNILVMQKGKIVESGSADQIYNHPQMDYTKKLLAAVPKGKYLE